MGGHRRVSKTGLRQGHYTPKPEEKPPVLAPEQREKNREEDQAGEQMLLDSPPTPTRAASPGS